MSGKILKREVKRKTSVNGRRMSKKSSKKQSKGSAKTSMSSFSYEYELKSCTTWEYADMFQNIDNWHESLQGEDSLKQPIKIEPQMTIKEESSIENVSTGDERQNKNAGTVEDEPVATEGCNTTAFNGTVIAHSTALVYRRSISVQNDDPDISLGTMKKPLRATDPKHQTTKKMLSQKSDLMTQQHIHSGEKPFKCTVCPKMFLHNCDLTKHLRVHSGEKPFKCKECPKMFSQKSNLMKHQRIHSGEKPFKCAECPQVFAQKCHLTAHQRVHTGEKPFKCAECQKMFSHKWDLTRHQRIHSGEKPFKCTNCPQAFLWKSQLKTHQHIHSG